MSRREKHGNPPGEPQLAGDGSPHQRRIGDYAPYLISRSETWIPFSDTTDIVPGSALDFSKLGWIDAPAGKYGRVVAKGPHFEFEKLPGVQQRFYGCNLCFSANYLSCDNADSLCSRLVRMGYNALRIHHYESLLCDQKDGTTLRPDRMAQLDGLLNACIKYGIYLTTDLFVSRSVKWRTCGIDRDARSCSARGRGAAVRDSVVMGRKDARFRRRHGARFLRGDLPLRD